jgi:hypothetical protein
MPRGLGAHCRLRWCSDHSQGYCWPGLPSRRQRRLDSGSHRYATPRTASKPSAMFALTRLPMAARRQPGCVHGRRARPVFDRRRELRHLCLILARRKRLLGLFAEALHALRGDAAAHDKDVSIWPASSDPRHGGYPDPSAPSASPRPASARRRRPVSRRPMNHGGGVRTAHRDPLCGRGLLDEAIWRRFRLLEPGRRVHEELHPS